MTDKRHRVLSSVKADLKARRRPSVLMADFFERFVWLDQNLQRILRKRGWPPVSRTESQILLLISSGVTQQNEIAAVLGISPQAVNQSSNLLVQKGIICLEPDPEDRRKRVITFPAKGEQMRKEATAILLWLESKMKATLGSKKFDALVAAMSVEVEEEPDLAEGELDDFLYAVDELTDQVGEPVQ